MLFSDKYDFWIVYDCIKKYYPIGVISHPEERRLLKQYKGQTELESAIVENIHNNFTATWGPIKEKIESVTGKKVTGTTYGQDPCFSGYIEINKFIDQNFTRYKELHFFISLLGPFYSIIGVDRNEIEFAGQKVYPYNYLVVSPENEFSEEFKLIETAISEQFSEHRQLPFSACRLKLDGLQVKHNTENNYNTVFHALFNGQINLQAEYIGDEWYGSDKWIRKDYDSSKEGGWTVYPIKN